MTIEKLKTIYKVNDNNYNRYFAVSDNGYSLLNWNMESHLYFNDSKKWVVKSFHRALWLFLETIEEGA